MTATDKATAAAAFAEIIANRADDAPRLIYADWLEEHGQPERAEFIRVQIELASLHCAHVPEYLPCDQRHGPSADWCSNCKQIRELRRRERELLREHWQDWSDPIPATIALMKDHCQEPRWEQFCKFRRGFVTEVTCTAADWLTHADALTAACPLERVKLTSWPDMNCEAERPDKGYVGYSFRDERLPHAFADCEGFDCEAARTEAAAKTFRAVWPAIEFSFPSAR